MSRATVILLFTVLIAAAAGWFLFANDNGGDQPTPAAAAEAVVPVVGYRVELRDIADRTEALGTLRAQESVEITATVTETVTELRFDDGDRVEAGQVIAVLAQAEQRAELEDAREQVAQEERELRRIEALVQRKLAAATELDSRRTLLARARHRVAALQVRIDDRTLRAPFAGQLGLRRVSVGTLVSPGSVITTLDDTRRMKLDFTVPSALLGSLREGQRVIATTSAFEHPFQGTVAAIDSRINPVNRSVTARALFDNDDGLLKPGMLMTVALQRSPRRALVVPEESLLPRQQRQYVLVIDRDASTVVEREVSIGARQPGWAEITSGLQAGDWVVREGIGSAIPGARVQVGNREALAAEGPPLGAAMQGVN